MAKYRRTRKYTRSRRGRWSPNIQELRTTSISPVQSGVNYATTTLAFNPIQTSTAVSQIYTVKNFDINFIFEVLNQGSLVGIEDICAYIMFVPQGMNITADYNIQHPEYIMAHKFVGSPAYEPSSASTSNPLQGQQYQPYRVRTRLSRKLNTGDSVILFIKYNLQNSQPAGESFYVSGLARWWTKAN